MVRQQMFLREVQRQALRWSGNRGRVLAMTRAIMGQTTTDLDSLSKLLPVVNLALTLNTARIYQTHVEGSTPTINGVDYVVDTPEQIAAAVKQFENPGQPKASTAGGEVPKSAYLVTVSNGTGSSGLAQRTAAALQTRGYHVGPPLTSSQTSAQTVVYAPESLAGPAQQLANLCAPATLQLSPRAPGNDGHILIVLGSNYGGSLTTATPAPQAAPTVEKGQRYDWSAWRALAKTTSLKLKAPTLWAPGLGYDTAGVPSAPTRSRPPPSTTPRQPSPWAPTVWATGACRPCTGRIAGDRQPKLGAEDQWAHLPLLLPGQEPAYGRLEAEWRSLLGRQHARQPDSQ